MRVDLHIHTTASDGCWDPEDVVKEIKEAEIGLFAIADHDTAKNVSKVSELANEAGIGFIPAVEITTKYKDFICHILGYGIDPTDKKLLTICKNNTEEMRKLNNKQAEKLSKLGLPIDVDEFRAYKYDRKRGGASIINFLIDKGIFKNFEEALKYIIGKIDFSLEKYPSPSEVVNIIKNASGHSILAHPGSKLLNKPLDMKSIEELIASGIEGLECFTNYHDKETTEKFLAFCKKRDLLITAGSDCHGPLLKSRKLGHPIAHLKDLNLRGIWAV